MPLLHGFLLLQRRGLRCSRILDLRVLPFCDPGPCRARVSDGLFDQRIDRLTRWRNANQSNVRVVKADITRAMQNVRYWPKAGIPNVAFDVAFGGKADMAFCAACVCF